MTAALILLFLDLKQIRIALFQGFHIQSAQGAVGIERDLRIIQQRTSRLGIACLRLNEGQLDGAIAAKLVQLALILGFRGRSGIFKGIHVHTVELLHRILQGLNGVVRRF
ncbi:hypothetical protein SDC9_167533 [bioreactor metagenome]|uniref:Uncharacterized protein n=1 Tax=bioreactor metagenome TaxID=1076179 RepID=A0A645G1W1_9ZZZZ